MSVLLDELASSLELEELEAILLELDDSWTELDEVFAELELD